MGLWQGPAQVEGNCEGMTQQGAYPVHVRARILHAFDVLVSRHGGNESDLRTQGGQDTGRNRASLRKQFAE